MPAVIINIQRQPGANIIAVVDRIKALLPQLHASLPSAIDVAVLTDRTTTIRASVKDVQFSLILTVALVVMVIFLFLRNLAATIIPSVAVPLSLVGTFGVMYLLGYSLNNLTLMALTISTGFVVDDAIVMIENISRYLEAAGRSSAGGAQRLRTDRLHDCVVDGFADRGVDSAAVHGRYRRTAVPRIRDHAGGDDFGFGGRVADAHADDVREDSCGTGRKRTQGWFYRKSEDVFNWVIAHVRSHAADGCLNRQRMTLAGDARHAVGDDPVIYRRSEGIFPGAGYRRDSGRLGSAADDFVSGNVEAAAGFWRMSFEGSGG